MPSERPRPEMIVIDGFYENPDVVRSQALSLDYHYPYAQDSGEQAEEGRRGSFQRANYQWMASNERRIEPSVMGRLSALVGAPIDEKHWNEGTRWNGHFHAKLERSGFGIHNHVNDAWNGCGVDGWSAVVFLTPGAPLERGLQVWRDPHGRYGADASWVIDPDHDRWDLMASLSNVYNRLVLLPASAYHSGAVGWGTKLQESRLIQTFFFREA